VAADVYVDTTYPNHQCQPISQSVPNLALLPVARHPCSAWLYLIPPRPTQREPETCQTLVALLLASAATVRAKPRAASVRTAKVNELYFESIIGFG
jgi:hypothetical protein